MSERIASSFRCIGELTRTMPFGGNTAKCRFLIGFRTTKTSIVPIARTQESILILVLDDLE